MGGTFICITLMCSSQAREAVLAPAQRTVEVEAHHVVLEEAGVRWATF